MRGSDAVSLGSGLWEASSGLPFARRLVRQKMAPSGLFVASYGCS